MYNRPTLAMNVPLDFDQTFFVRVGHGVHLGYVAPSTIRKPFERWMSFKKSAVMSDRKVDLMIAWWTIVLSVLGLD